MKTGRSNSTRATIRFRLTPRPKSRSLPSLTQVGLTPTMPGATQQKHNPAYWTGPMVATDSNRDTTSKQLLQYTNAASGGLLLRGQSAAQDLDGAIDNIFNHPNLPPFVSRELDSTSCDQQSKSCL